MSAEDIIVALQEIDYNAVSVTQMTAKYSTMKGGVSHTSLSIFLVTLTRNQKPPEIFKLTTLCNIVIKVEAYISQNGLTQCYNCQRFGHIWVHCRQPPRCLWCPNLLQLRLQYGESPKPASYRSCSHAKQELQCRRNLRATSRGSDRGIFFTKYTTPDLHFLLLYAAPISSISSDHHNKNSNSLQ
jgi:hypothetical protein